MVVKQVTRMEVDGSVVELRAISNEIIIRYGDRARSIYEVYVDDVMRGYVYFPNGWGGDWQLLSLRPQHRYDPVYHKHDDVDRTQYGIAQFYRALSPGSLNEPEDWGPHARKWLDRNAILDAFPRIVALGRAPSPDEAAAKLAQDKIDYAEKLVQDAAEKERWKAEDAAREKQRVEAAAIAERIRCETLEALEGIRDRLAPQMTNFEIDALERAIGQWRPK